MLTTRLDRPTVRAAIALANRAPSIHNSQPWRWRIGASSVHLFADPERALPATDPEGRDLLISCGAALHHLRTALLATGSAGRVDRMPDPAHPHHLAAVELAPAEPTADDLALARAIENRHSDRRVFSTWEVPDEFLEDLRRAAVSEGATFLVLDPNRRWEVTRLIERAAVQQALTPGHAQEVAAWSGRARGAAEGVPAANVPGDVTAEVPVRHFAAHEMPQNGLGRYESDGTVLALLATDGDGPVDRLRAGEALSAVLLAATATGLATDPISQPFEVPETRARLAADCLPSGRSPHVLIRLGWAPIGATPVPPTGRRPVDDTIDAFDEPWT
ncbi:hypothetical protein [Blastococcus sp. URHD0036]|uniref:Acg family FMN-binding oxidoreductase n=1 Tax=Blastococcus sp. URHD0036 TaxID=1380356 RepID=UPI0005561A5D|nr:hypothetical protein [Blastococcus sp. URHD0036]